MRGVRHVACLVLALAPAVLSAAPPEVPPSLTVGAGKVKEFIVKGDKGKDFGFKLVGGPAAFREVIGDIPGERVFWLIPETDAPASIVWWTVGEKASAVTEINKGAPVPPVPPDPKPPVPPTPVAENPFGPQPGLRVLIVYEEQQKDTYPQGQRFVLAGAKFRDFVDKECASDGYRFFDQNVKWTKDEWWSPAMKRTDRKKLPWIYIGKESAGYSGELPADPDFTIALIQKIVGGK